MIGVSIGVDLARDSSCNGVMSRHAGQTKQSLRAGRATAVLRMVVLGNDLDLLVEDLPQLDGLV